MDRKKLIPMMLAALLSLGHSGSVHAAQAKHEQALSAALSCQRASEAEEVLGLIRRLGGQPIVDGGLPEDAEFTLPNPIEIYGRPVNTIYVRPVEDRYGYYVEYGALFDGESIEAVADIAGILPDRDNVFRQEIDGRELMLRPESGESWIVCANELHSNKRKFLSMLKGIAREMSKPLKDGGRSPAQEINARERVWWNTEPAPLPELEFERHEHEDLRHMDEVLAQ